MDFCKNFQTDFCKKKTDFHKIFQMDFHANFEMNFRNIFQMDFRKIFKRFFNIFGWFQRAQPVQPKPATLAGARKSRQLLAVTNLSG